VDHYTRVAIQPDKLFIQPDFSHYQIKQHGIGKSELIIYSDEIKTPIGNIETVILSTAISVSY